MGDMNLGWILRMLPVLFLGYFASGGRVREVNSGQNSTISNEVGNQISNTKIPVADKPCQRNQKRIRSFIFPPKFRPFVPICDSDGFYMPLQCHQASRYCWCVNKHGNMKPGTRTRGTIDCGMKELKKPCEGHRSRFLKHRANGHRSVFIPKCGEDGYYAPMQCSANKKYCWCVHKNGNKKKGTRTKGLADCSEKKEQEDKSTDIDIQDAFSANGAANGPCSRQKQRRKILIKFARGKIFDPNCADDGYYSKKQCHSGHCWCSDRNGNRIAGSKRKGDVDCESGSSSGPTRPPRNRCHIVRRKALTSPLSKKQFIPLCSSDGSYAPLQCDTHQGHCWCADQWGKEIENTRTRRTPKCLTNGFTEHKKKPCYELKKYMKQLPAIVNVNIPVCKRSGVFKPLQCSRDKKYCWCVEQDGTEITGTLKFGKPECPERVMNMTYVKVTKGPCIRHKMKRKKLFHVLRRNLFDPRCNKEGFYDVKQCHGKYCWCTDANNKMMRGTRKKGEVNCAKVSNPVIKTCLVNRLKALRISLRRKPYVPQCESDGSYTPLQCNSYTGVCWCVNKQGKEIARTKSKRTPNCFAHAFNTIQDGPCHILQTYISKLPPNNKVNDPNCERNGFFQPVQCSKTNGFCWCVMHDGTEVQGSIKIGRPVCQEKRFPAVPRLHGPCDEHLAHVSNMRSGERKNVYLPVCDNEGYYAPHQCNNDTTWCWCVDKYGSIIEGTRRQGKLPICDENILKPCIAYKRKGNSASNSDINAVYEAVCTKEGHFAPLQCNKNSGHCWCVDEMGRALAGTTIYERPYCGSERRKCEIERRKLLSEDQPANVPPSCDFHGYYSRIQCDPFTQECWCSDRYGKETNGTRIKGIANCGQLPRPCNEHLSSVLNYDNLFGVFIPQCDSQGYYNKIQCHGKTNVCWCSTKLGVEVPGTKRKGQPNCIV